MLVLINILVKENTFWDFLAREFPLTRLCGSHQQKLWGAVKTSSWPSGKWSVKPWVRVEDAVLPAW